MTEYRTNFRRANKNDLQSVYVLHLKNRKYYVGITPTWKLEDRWEDHHCRDKNRGARWTNRWQPIEKIKVYKDISYDEAVILEQDTVKKIMRIAGLDSCRGGKWNMWSMGDTWWVPDELKNVPRIVNESDVHESILEML